MTSEARQRGLSSETIRAAGRSRMKGRVALAAVSLVLLAAAALAALLWKIGASPEAAGSAPGGRIAFSAPEDSGSLPFPPSDLYVIDADGSGRRRLADCDDPFSIASARRGEFGCILRAFAWSPDGRSEEHTSELQSHSDLV